ncbi:MAG: Hsp70 family protein, partial [Planctomycetia bacterium]|nr:Hsp70 family protein [Planctomycetia bacterium]
VNVPDAKGKNIIVYDLGGGTFDVTVVRIGSDPDKNEIDIICTEGDHMLGGKDWDDAIFNYYDEQFRNETGSEASLKDDNETAYDLRLAAENDKKTLTNRDKVSRRVSFDGEKVVVELTLEKFNELTDGLLEKTVTLTEAVLEQAKSRGIEKIDAFLLVGGSTRMRQIESKIKEVFTPRLGVEPAACDVDEAVAKGAAIVGEFAAIKNYVFGGLGITPPGETSGEDAPEPVMPTQEQIAQVAEATGKTEEEILLAVSTSITKVATKSYGIQALKDGKEIIRNLVIKQSPVPAAGSQVFKTACANAEEIDLIVFANNESCENAEPEMGEEIGRVVFPLPQNLPDRAPIEITFNLRDDGTLFMTALDQTYNQKIDANFQAAGVMSEEELAAAQRQARSIIVD